jgi:hypothetical protein
LSAYSDLVALARLCLRQASKARTPPAADELRRQLQLVGDVDGHVVGVGHYSGLASFPDGSVGTANFTFTIDYVKGAGVYSTYYSMSASASSGHRATLAGDTVAIRFRLYPNDAQFSEFRATHNPGCPETSYPANPARHQPNCVAAVTVWAARDRSGHALLAFTSHA